MDRMGVAVGGRVARRSKADALALTPSPAGRTLTLMTTTMGQAGDALTLTVPRSAVGGVVELSAALLDRMHELLERNTDGALSAVEQQQLETLVLMAQFGQLVSTALGSQQGKP